VELLLTIFVFILILSVLVLIHEAGHYFVAKKFGIKVEEFGFGFPPKAFSIKRGETEYSINWLPIGGFVKLYGEDEVGGGKVSLKADHTDVKKDVDRAFFSRPVWQRAAVVVAGVVMNAILAVVIFYTFLGISNFKTELPLLGNFKFFGVNQSQKTDVIINTISKNSPAEKIGIKIPVKIIAINNKRVASADEFVKIINANKGKEITLSWQDIKNNKMYSAKVTPRKNPPKDEGALGIGFFPLATAVLHYETPVQKAFSGFIHPVNLMVYNFDIMGRLIAVSFKEKTVEPVSQGVAGPVGIGSLVGSILQLEDAKERVLQLLNLAGILSISLAFFNVLPIPALDGGRLFFILFEGVTGRKVNPRFESYVHAIGMAVLLTLIVLITFKDIFQFFR